MITAVYFSDHSVRVLVGRAGKKRIDITEAFQKELPEGCIVNGEIRSAAEAAAVLSEIWKEHGLKKRHVWLVANAAPVTLKRLEFPKMKEKELQKLIPGELGADPENDIVDYMHLPGEQKRTTVYAASGQRAYLAQYREVFQKAGIRPEKFLLSRLCLEKLLAHTQALQGGCSIVQVLDRQQMTSVLWEDGKAVYMTRSTISGEYGSFQFGLQVARSVSSLQQFNMTQKKQKIGCVYLSGIYGEDFLICEEAIRQMAPDVEVKPFEKDASVAEKGSVSIPFGKYLWLAGALFGQRSEINLLPAQKESKSRRQSSAFRKYAELPLLLAVGCGAIAAALIFSNNLKQEMLQDLQTYISDPVNAQKCSEADALDLENGRLQNQVTAVSYMDQVLASYPKADSSVIERVMQCAEGKASVAVQSYLAQEGLLTLDVSVEEADLCNQFVATLQETGLFHRIDYTGYTYAQSDKTYRVNVLCYLKESTGEEEVEG